MDPLVGDSSFRNLEQLAPERGWQSAEILRAQEGRPVADGRVNQPLERDSLQGRYHYYRLHPLSLHELNGDPRSSDLETLLGFGGFPEPFLKQDNRHWKRWQRERTSRVIQEDLISLESVREVSQLQLLAQMLPERIGSILSIANLRKDLSVAFETADKWVGIFENLYYCFRIMPYGLPHLRAVKKERKLYLWDWSLCRNEAARFENLVASHLLKYCHFTEDTQGDDMSLRFLRDATGIPRFYQVHLNSGGEDTEWTDYKARILPFVKLAKELKL